MFLINATNKYILYHTGRGVKGHWTSQSSSGISAQPLLRYFDKDSNTSIQAPMDVPILILHYNKYNLYYRWRFVKVAIPARVFLGSVHKLCVMFSDYLYAFHMQTYSDCSFIFRSWSTHPAWLLSLYHYIVISVIIVRYNLLQVQLSLVDAHRPLLSSTYTSIYNEEYINCTIRTLRP